MPYEVDRRALLASVSEIWDRSPDASILVPWAYTDFNFLRVMRSSAPIYGVNSPSEEVVTESPLVGAWRERYASWYGPSYLAEPEQLEALLDRGPVYYLGWHRYPPIEFSEDLARRLRLKRIEESIRGIDVLDHLETSWVWNWPEVSLIREGGVGQYEYYLVGPLDSSVGTP